jgi:transcriptional regulator with XRE-family HTH domain
VFKCPAVLHTLCVTRVYRLLGRNIARYRRTAKLTQEELAEKTDYSVDFIGLVERGVNAPTVARLKDIADAVGVEVWQLFYPQNAAGSNGGPHKTRAQASRNRS